MIQDQDRRSKLYCPNMEVVIQPSANTGATSGRDACIDGSIRPTRDSKVISSQRQRAEHRVYHCNRNVAVLSLIEAEKGGDVFEMHRLVQLCMQSWLAMESKAETYQAEAVEILSRN